MNIMQLLCIIFFKYSIKKYLKFLVESAGDANVQVGRRHLCSTVYVLHIVADGIFLLDPPHLRNTTSF